MTTVYEQPGVPVVRIMQAATKWISEQLIRWQPGAYQSSPVDGGHFESPYGVKLLPARLETSVTDDQVTYSTSCLVRQPDGSTRTYMISVRVCGTPVGDDHG